MSDKKDGESKHDLTFYGDYETVDLIKLSQEAAIMASSDAEAPLTKSEREQMADFFRGYPKEESEIIIQGICPRCHAKGTRSEWKPVGIGYKECTRCDWRDY